MNAETSRLSGQRPASDSWTAVGTILDHETLNIVCPEEQLGYTVTPNPWPWQGGTPWPLRHSDEVFLPVNAKQTWLDWAATEPWQDEDAAVVVSSP